MRKEHATAYEQPSTQHYIHIGGRWGLGFRCLFHPESCLTKLSRCRLGGIQTCRKCIKAMRLPRWNGVLGGFSAGLLRCNTRPRHCFLGWHPKSECIISNFCLTFSATVSSVFSQRKNQERTCMYEQPSTQHYKHTLAGSEGCLSDAFFILFD